MSAQERWLEAESRPQPAPISGLSRAQVAARITLARQILDAMVASAELDGAVGWKCRGSVKLELIALEAELRGRS